MTDPVIVNVEDRFLEAAKSNPTLARMAPRLQRHGSAEHGSVMLVFSESHSEEQRAAAFRFIETIRTDAKKFVVLPPADTSLQSEVFLGDGVTKMRVPA